MENLGEVDNLLAEVDGTPNFVQLGANVAVGVSIAATRALARDIQVPLWQLMNSLLNEQLDRPVQPILPVPSFNVINGGEHAANQLDFQEFMIAPLGMATIEDRVRAGAEVYATLRGLLSGQSLSTGLGDEGGFAPQIDAPEQALELLAEAITRAGYTAGMDGIAIALDPAANSLVESSGLGAAHDYLVAGVQYGADGLIDYYEHLIDRFPIWSIEDGLSENDWDGWALLQRRLGDRIQIMGDDLFVTNPGTIERGISQHCANAALIKPNQIGTVTQTLQAVATCYRAGWSAMVSHRSGETPDTFVADLTVGIGCGQIKSGAPARGDRTAKYNRLLEISRESDVADPHPLESFVPYSTGQAS